MSAPRIAGPPPSGAPYPNFVPRYGGYTMRPLRPGGRGGGDRDFQRDRDGGGPRDSSQIDDFDGKRPRKSVMRRTVDYNSSFVGMVERRVWQRDFRDKRALQPDVMHYPQMLPPVDYPENPTNAVTTKFVKTATNKMRCPIFTLAWTPEGRRLITGKMMMFQTELLSLQNV